MPLGELRGRQPAWFPDGSQIAFVDERHRLAIARSDGAHSIILTSGRYPIREPSWSPDGSRIAFMRHTRSRIAGDIFVIAANPSGTARRVTNTLEDNSKPAWSPSGSRIAFSSNRDPARRIGDRGIYAIRPDMDPAWQPVCSRPGTSQGDSLRGTAADDRLCGFAGNDAIRGGTGRDGLYGGEGADRLFARDRSFDVVGCGAGRDEVVADRVDLVGVDCERVRRA